MYEKTLICSRSIWDRFNGAKKQKRTVLIDPEKQKFNCNDRAEDSIFLGFKVIRKKDGQEMIDARFYSKTGRRVTCCLWIHTPEVVTQGSGSAAGYGYDRKSSALAEAITHAGVQNFPAFAGSGCNREAILFLAKVLGLSMKSHLLVEFYG